jgi:hypothetical protein
MLDESVITSVLDGASFSEERVVEVPEQVEATDGKEV